MKKRKFKILKVEAKKIDEGRRWGNNVMVIFHTKVGPFRYLLSNEKVLKRFAHLNPNLLPKNEYHVDLADCVGKFLFVPERNK